MFPYKSANFKKKPLKDKSALILHIFSLYLNLIKLVIKLKISTKLCLWIFICILIIETVSMTFLHKNVIHSLITEELETLKARGNSHRDVLENSFNPSTLQHIGLMEFHTDTEVVITDKNGEVLLSSKQLDIYMKKIIEQPFSQTSRNGLIVQSEWDKERYIATVTPFKTDDSKVGYVYMFENTENIKALVSKLNVHFVLAFIVLFFFMLMTIFFLSRALTKPLILMKESTTKLSK